MVSEMTNEIFEQLRTDDEFVLLMLRGQNIDAIRYIRSKRDLGLKEAKDLFEEFVEYYFKK